MKNYLGRVEEFILRAVRRLPLEQAYTLQVRELIWTVLGQRYSIGFTYATLCRLEKKRLVSSVWTDPTPERGGRSKRVFRLEPAGELALSQFADDSKKIDSCNLNGSQTNNGLQERPDMLPEPEGVGG